MYADPDFADLSQEVGLASLGASDEEIEKLARCYWHSIEFGATREAGKGKEGELKAYGAGLLSSYGEMEYACAPADAVLEADNGAQRTRPGYLPWEPKVASVTEFPITDYQPVYFVSESLIDAKNRMRRF